MSPRIPRRAVWIVLGALVLVAAGGAIYWKRWSTQAAPTYVVRDPALRKEPLYFYPSQAGPPRAFLFFYGNDVAFWEPHQALAHRLSQEGYSVVGIDLRKYLDELPSNSVAARDSAFAASIDPLIARVRTEIGADSLPLILGGHSFGAEVALWTAMHTPPPKLVGVLVMSTRSTGHFFVTPADWANQEAKGPGSFSTIELMRDIPQSVRIAVVRGQRDGFAHYDSTFAAVAGPRYRRFFIPFTGHSIQKLILAGPYIERAMAFLSDTSRAK